jgi:hypothetical protein
MQRRELSEMLAEVAENLLAARRPGVDVRARRIDLDLPVEVRLVAHAAGAPVLSGDLPVWRWRTAFDQRPSRLRVSWTESDGS